MVVWGDSTGPTSLANPHFLWGSLQLAFEVRQKDLHSLPYQIQVGFEVAVDHSVAHALHLVPWNVGLLVRDSPMFVQNLRRGLANYQPFILARPRSKPAP